MSPSNVVGEFHQTRAIHRLPRNPLDKATIVSIYPKQITEVKETLQPRSFTVPAGSYKKPALLTVGSAGWIRDEEESRPAQEIPVAATTLANSIIVDYCNGLLGCDMDSKMPGLFFIPGTIELEEVHAKFKIELSKAKNRQDNWFKELIKLADSLWARSNNNPLVIWEEMRLAARELGQDTKPWLKDYQNVELEKCFACGGLRNPLYPICPTCKVVDPNHPLAKDLKFAQ